MRIHKTTSNLVHADEHEPAAPLFASLSRRDDLLDHDLQNIDRLFAGEARGTSHEAILRRQLEQAQAQLLRYARDLCRMTQSSERNISQRGSERDQPKARLRRGDGGRGMVASVHEVELPQVISVSQAFEHALALCRKVAGTDATVLINGETGTGKEVCASVIHHASPRHHHRLVAINCAALPESLLESELFGHEAGAFTGANHQKAGLFEAAQGGTLFLDEIGEMALNVQAKFLRVLEERSFTRVGSTRSIKADVRIIAATNRDLAHEVKQGRFRSDLYYRLNVVPIEIPALRQRCADIPALVDHFIRTTTRRMSLPVPLLDLGVMESLLAYHWPGNVRELRNVIERLVVLCEADRIRVADLPVNIRTIADLVPPCDDEQEADDDSDLLDDADDVEQIINQVERASKLDDHERSLIQHTLNEMKWNQSAAARRLGVPRSTLRYLIRKHGLRMTEKTSPP